jgi:hypothetical protein
MRRCLTRSTTASASRACCSVCAAAACVSGPAVTVATSSSACSCNIRVSNAVTCTQHNSHMLFHLCTQLHSAPTAVLPQMHKQTASGCHSSKTGMPCRQGISQAAPTGGLPLPARRAALLRVLPQPHQICWPLPLLQPSGCAAQSPVDITRATQLATEQLDLL